MLAFEFVAVLAATLFSGAAIYISLAEQGYPAKCLFFNVRSTDFNQLG